jgi:hypothetical protein
MINERKRRLRIVGDKIIGNYFDVKI